jgi:hypothetical protein
LYYKKNGQLTDAGVDLVKYCDYLSEEETDRMGGEALEEVLEMIENSNEQLAISFDFTNNTAAVVQIDKSTGTGPILSSEQGMDLTKSTVMEVSYDEYKICVGFKVIDDIFRFGFIVLREEENVDIKTKMLVTNILKDCNYKTFLDSKSPDKYENLARRIFLV